MADMWYFAKDQKKLGPFSSAEFKELADTGQVLPTDMVWKEGIEKGVLAAKVKNLFSTPPAGVSPAPAAAEEGIAAQEPLAEGKPEREEVQPSPLPNDPVPTAPAATSTGSAEEPATPPQGSAAAATAAEVPRKKTPIQPQASAPKARVFRVVGATGAIILGQDGTSVKYKKKCPKCGTEDSSVRTMQIRSGINRDRYFCQKCKKLQHVEIHGAL